MSEKEESVLRNQTILMIARNYDKPKVIKRVQKRFKKCIKIS